MSSSTLERVAAIARLVVMVVCMVGGYLGLSVDASDTYAVVMVVLALIVGIYSWWKNANITDAAQAAQSVLDYLKCVDSDATVSLTSSDDSAESSDVTDGASEIIGADGFISG